MRCPALRRALTFINKTKRVNKGERGKYDGLIDSQDGTKGTTPEDCATLIAKRHINLTIVTIKSCRSGSLGKL